MVYERLTTDANNPLFKEPPGGPISEGTKNIFTNLRWIEDTIGSGAREAVRPSLPESVAGKLQQEGGRLASDILGKDKLSVQGMYEELTVGRGVDKYPRLARGDILQGMCVQIKDSLGGRGKVGKEKARELLESLENERGTIPRLL